MRKELPYFMSNKEWYRYNKESMQIEMTDKAPADAIKAYEEFMNSNIKDCKDGELF